MSKYSTAECPHASSALWSQWSNCPAVYRDFQLSGNGKVEKIGQKTASFRTALIMNVQRKHASPKTFRWANDNNRYTQESANCVSTAMGKSKSWEHPTLARGVLANILVAQVQWHRSQKVTCCTI